MKTWIKRAAIGMGALFGLAGLAVATALHVGEQTRTRVIRVEVAALDLDNSPATLDRGRYLFNSRGCADCHGARGAGRTIIDGDGMLVVAPNITGGANGVVKDYDAGDWLRVLRHGVKPDGRPVQIMPSEDWNRMSDEDAVALISYARQLPPVAGVAARIETPLPFKLMYGLGVIQDAAAKIDHTLPPEPAVTPAVSVQHGMYVANMCMGCHGANLSGGKIAGGPPSWPAAANLTPGPGSVLPRYPDAASFRDMMRSGLRPDGSRVDPAMPFAALRNLNDTDLDAMYHYFQSLPPRATGLRP
ncbi:cytochrome C [Massilia sp. KIM]|uniref:c-type cytochrome n=1 Tax=Massilia sp. KIM TaxID=1955422 RepID=UPI00098F2248|nr:c-type cytochrome [Massilia sp. KIM]OON61096.1 cytochrome C [Massilia sp. KIM]